MLKKTTHEQSYSMGTSEEDIELCTIVYIRDYNYRMI